MIRKNKEEDKTYLYSIINKEFNTNYKDNTYTNWYIYEEDNKIIGFINYDIIYDKSEIEYIFVDYKYRNKKIATKLLNKMIDDLNNKNIKNITLEVRSDNKSAISFYEKNSFKAVAIRKNYYKDTDAILMMRSW